MTNDDLQILVEEISKKLFHLPFQHKATYNNKLRTTGGRYILRTNNIEINPKYLNELGVEEVVGIIKHELCHYHLHLQGKGYKHRDLEFKHLLKTVDAPRYCSPLTSTTQKRRSGSYRIYECSKCKQEYRRKKRVNTEKYVCGNCKGKLKEVVVKLP